MCLQRGRNLMNRMTRAGYAFLIPASLSNFYLVRHFGVPDGIGDGVTGLLYGFSIGCFIAGMRAARG